MAQYRDLNAPPGRALAGIVAELRDQAKSSKTGAAGVKDLGGSGDVVWSRPDGTPVSVRDVDLELEEARARIGEAEESLTQTGERLETAEGVVAGVAEDLTRVETVVIPGVVADLEAADQAAQQVLGELDSRLTDIDAVGTGELASIRDALTAAQDAVDAAQQVATEANTAANAASQAALEAAGIAESKGRVIVSETEPTGEDRNTANIWIKPVPDDPDTEVEEKAVTYVYLEATDEWQPTTSSELAQAAQNALDAREAAQQAQQRADTAISNAATAQSAAEAAQRTADTATTDAREAHNAAVAAADTAAAIRADMASGPTLWEDPSFERGMGPLPGPYKDRIERSQEWAASGEWSVKYTASGNGGNVFGTYIYIPAVPGRWYAVSAVVHAGEHAQTWRTYWTAWTSGDPSGSVVRDVGNTFIEVGPGETKSDTLVFQCPENAAGFRFWCALPSQTNGADRAGEVVYLDDFRLVDVTESYPQYLAAKQAADAAQARADEAWELADSKPDMAEVKTEIRSSANGKNATTVSADAPTASTPGVVAGDTWWRVDSSGFIFGQWRWTGSIWSPAAIRHDVIASADIGKLVVVGDAHFTEAVVERMFADIFTAHKITAGEMTVAAIDGDGNLAEGSVGSTQILPGAVKTGNIEFTGTLAGKVAQFMSVSAKEAVITGGLTANAATLIGQTVVDDINVQGKLIGRDGVFTGTVDFENINVSDQVLAERLAGEHIYGTVIEGGEIRTTDGLPGQVILSDEGYVEPGDQTRRPGIRIIPLDTSELVTPPGMGPNENGFIITGGRNKAGGRGFSIYAPTQAAMGFQKGDARSNVAVSDGYAWVTARDSNGNRGEIMARSTYSQVKATAADGAEGLIQATTNSATVTTKDPGGNMMSRIVSVGREAFLSSTGSDGRSRILSVDSGGVWVKVERDDGSGLYDRINLTGSTWEPLELRNGWTAYTGGGGYYKGLRAQRTPLGIRLDGTIQGGSKGEVARLPADMQNVAAKQFPVATSGGPAVMGIYGSANGLILGYLSGPDNPGFVSVSVDAALA